MALVRYWMMIRMLLWNDFDNIVSSCLCCFKTTYQILPTPLRSCKKRINRASRHWILRTLVHTELELKSNNKNEVPGECFYTRQLCILLFKYKKKHEMGWNPFCSKILITQQLSLIFQNLYETFKSRISAFLLLYSWTTMYQKLRPFN